MAALGCRRIAAFLLLAAPAAAGEKPVRIAIVCDANGRLETIRVGEDAVQRIGDEPLESFVARVVPRRRRAITLTNTADTPYRCIGGFIFSLQRLGYGPIGFISEPPQAQ